MVPECLGPRYVDDPDDDDEQDPVEWVMDDVDNGEAGGELLKLENLKYTLYLMDGWKGSQATELFVRKGMEAWTVQGVSWCVYILGKFLFTPWIVTF